MTMRLHGVMGVLMAQLLRRSRARGDGRYRRPIWYRHHTEAVRRSACALAVRNFEDFSAFAGRSATVRGMAVFRPPFARDELHGQR